MTDCRSCGSKKGHTKKCSARRFFRCKWCGEWFPAFAQFAFYCCRQHRSAHYWLIDKSMSRGRSTASILKSNRARDPRCLEKIRSAQRCYYHRHKREDWHVEYRRMRKRIARRFFQTVAFFWRVEHMEQIINRLTKQTGNEDVKNAIDYARSLDTEQLKYLFSTGFRFLRSRMVKMAGYLVVLEERGEQVDGDRWMMKLLRKIGLGEWDVDVVMRFGGRPYTMASVAALSKEQQAKIMEMDESEVEKLMRRPKAKRWHDEINPNPAECRVTAPSLAAMAANASPGDVAEMCLELIRASRDQKEVAEKLLPELQRIKNTKKKLASH